MAGLIPEMGGVIVKSLLRQSGENKRKQVAGISETMNYSSKSSVCVEINQPRIDNYEKEKE